MSKTQNPDYQTVVVTGIPERETDKAIGIILVDTETGEMEADLKWLPKSQFARDPIPTENIGTYFYFIPRWLGDNNEIDYVEYDPATYIAPTTTNSIPENEQELHSSEYMPDPVYHD